MSGKIKITLIVFLLFSLFASISNAFACGGNGGKCGCMGENAPAKAVETHQCPGSCMCDVAGKNTHGTLPQDNAVLPSSAKI